MLKGGVYSKLGREKRDASLWKVFDYLSSHRLEYNFEKSIRGSHDEVRSKGTAWKGGMNDNNRRGSRIRTEHGGHLPQPPHFATFPLLHSSQRGPC